MSRHAILMGLLLALIRAVEHVTAQPPTEFPTFIDLSCNNYIGPDSDPVVRAYKANLKSISKQLEAQANMSTYFYSTSAGSGSTKLYGQYYCRGDIDPLLCAQCISFAGFDINSCYNFQPATSLYQQCALRTANQSMFGVAAHSPNFANSSRVTVADSARFGAVLKSTMDRLINTAAYGNGSRGYGAGEGVLSSSETLYGLVQCSPDLNGTQCESCLRSTYSLIPGIRAEWAEWALVLSPSCQLRYSNQGVFYARSNSPAPDLPLSPEIPPAPTVSVSVSANKGKKSSLVARAVIPAAVVAFLILVCVSVCLTNKRKTMLKPSSSKTQPVKIPTTEGGGAETEVETTECLQFDLKTIEGATNTFSLTNKLGQGGFGIVYQGVLEDGQDVAVKRLSKYSGQGTKEFKTEVEVVAKLQHINLVRLVGCCVDGEERLLVYEFLRNLSLDRYLFDENRSAYLTWAIRHRIIEGIARGLHYLHEDSRVKIVHRDLKTSNILLDDNLDPKIADFGLARLVKVDQTTSNTSKVVGTYGYMAPEYALAGRYSTKSDVYSFGVIVLEILSGKSNNLFFEMSHSEGLLGYAWRTWNEGVVDQFVDPILQKNYSKTEAERCLKLGLLCVQDEAASRPPMRAVLVMLNSNTADLPPPSSPSHSNYISNISSGDGTQEETIKKQEIESGFSSATISSQMDLIAR